MKSFNLKIITMKKSKTKKKSENFGKKVTVEFTITAGEKLRLTKNASLFESRAAYIRSILKGAKAI